RAGAGDDDAAAVRAPDRLGEPRSAEHGDDAALRAAGEEDARDARELLEERVALGVGARLDADDARLGAELAKDARVGLREICGRHRGRRKDRDDRAMTAGAMDHFAKHRAIAELVLGA